MRRNDCLKVKFARPHFFNHINTNRVNKAPSLCERRMRDCSPLSYVKSALRFFVEPSSYIFHDGMIADANDSEVLTAIC